MTTYLLIFTFTLNTIASQLLLKQAIKLLGSPSGIADVPRFLFSAALSPWVHASIALQIVGYAIWIIVISREKLGVAFALSGSTFYLLLSLAAWALFNERLTGSQWFGIGLITLGVMCLTADWSVTVLGAK